MKELNVKDKELLFKDLSARMPYGVKVKYRTLPLLLVSIRNDWGEIKVVAESTYNEHTYNIEDIRPYLRPMSSMTNREKEEFLNLLFDKEAKCFYIDEEGLIDGKTSDLMKEGLNYPAFCPTNIELYTNWLNEHHFDYRGLIEKDLAIAVTEENNPYKNK